MAIITLTTDLGLKDYYVSAVKGSILSQLPDVTLVDISHLVPSFNIQEAAYILKNSYPSFPEGTIHIIGVNAEATAQHAHIALQVSGHFFIGADNGIFSLLFDKTPDKIVELNIRHDSNNPTFPTRDVFAKAACHLARGGSIDLIGTAKPGVNERILFRPVSIGDNLRGSIIYIDSYNNVVTNITRKLVNETGKGRAFSIRFGSHEIEKLSVVYNDVVEGEILAMFNAAGHLEIAMNRGKASQLLNLHMGDTITLIFN
jgi:S-adenosylmethionine hydrolase